MEDTTITSSELNKNEGNQLNSNGVTHYNDDKGGFFCCFLILGTILGLSIGSGAWYSNLLVFLISVFNVKNISAAQIANIFNGFLNIIPIVAAILADSAFGSYSVILISSIFSLMGAIMLSLMVTIKSLRPPTCDSNSLCVPPTTFQYCFLYISLTLVTLGLGGSRFLLGTMGANQVSKPKQQASFFNWFVVIVYIGWIIGFTLLIYVETSVSWAFSFDIALVANVLAVVLFLFGSRIYRKISPQGSPFSSIARVFVASLKNINMAQPVNGRDSYFHQSEDSKVEPSTNIRFLNKAAMIKQGETHTKNLKSKSWAKCTIEEVEDVKKLIKLLPLWSSSILLSGVIAIIVSLTILMALVMDRQLGSHFKIPAGCFPVVIFIFTAITSSTLDRFVYPAYKKLTSQNLTKLQGIGVGHISNIIAAIAFALIERRRLKLVEIYHLTEQSNAVAPISALWLVLPLALMGIGEGFYLPPEIALFYQEFPKSLRSTSTAMVSLHIGAGFYLSSAFIDIVHRTSSWLPNDINLGRVDNACWVLAIVAAFNFGYFLMCATFYKFNNHDSTLGSNYKFLVESLVE